MRILILNTYSEGGGAAIAARRLAESLEREGQDVRMLTKANFNGFRARVSFLAERFSIYMANGRNKERLFRVSTASYGLPIDRHPWVRDWADVIHLHWINQGFVSRASLARIAKLGIPIVWTLHDYWPATGICHLPLVYHSNGSVERCKRYLYGCGACPLLSSMKKEDLSSRVFSFKASLLSRPPFHYIAVGSQQAAEVSKSPIIANRPLTVIPNGIDLNIWSPQDMRPVEIPVDAIPIVISAARLDDPVKGPNYWAPLAEELCKLRPELRKRGLLVFIGNIKNKSLLDGLAIPVLATAMIREPNKLARYYSAAAVTISTSNMETFGQTLIEALASGSPVASFDSGGPCDYIQKGINGYTAPVGDVQSLARATLQAIEIGATPEGRLKCRSSISHFDYTEIGIKTLDIYRSLFASL